jgi:hypothetical protein
MGRHGTADLSGGIEQPCGPKWFRAYDEGGGRTRRRALPRDRRQAARSREIVSARRRPEGDPTSRCTIRAPGGSSGPAGGIDDRDTHVLMGTAPKLVPCIRRFQISAQSGPAQPQTRRRGATSATVIGPGRLAGCPSEPLFMSSLIPNRGLSWQSLDSNRHRHSVRMVSPRMSSLSHRCHLLLVVRLGVSPVLHSRVTPASSVIC